jgi:hypothetical protein
MIVASDPSLDLSPNDFFLFRYIKRTDRHRLHNLGIVQKRNHQHFQRNSERNPGNDFKGQDSSKNCFLDKIFKWI